MKKVFLAVSTVMVLTACSGNSDENATVVNATPADSSMVTMVPSEPSADEDAQAQTQTVEEAPKADSATPVEQPESAPEAE